jgi:methionine-rich copper-binding protein CopC
MNFAGGGRVPQGVDLTTDLSPGAFMYRRALAAVLVSAAGAALFASPAWAHDELASSDPKTGAVLESAPKVATLTFSEPVDARFVTIAVKRSDGKRVAAAKPEVAGAVVRQPLDALGDGAYTVAYRIVSEDGHPVNGTVTFTVTAPVKSPPAASGEAGAPGKEVLPTPSAAKPPVRIEKAALAPTSDNRERTKLFFYVVIALLCLAGIAAASLPVASALHRRTKRRESV